MNIPRHNCIYVTKWNKCNHLDKRGFFGGKPCILDDDFVKECSKRIRHQRPAPPTGQKPPADD